MRSVKNGAHEPSSQAMWCAVNSSISSSAPMRAAAIRSGESCGQVEWPPKLPLRQHFQPEPAGLLSKPGQVVVGPGRPQIVTDHRIGGRPRCRFDSRAQHRVTCATASTAWCSRATSTSPVTR